MKEIRSKYQRKTLEEVEFYLFDYDCLKCNKPFMVDLNACGTEYDEDECEPRTIVYCPYCGTKHRIYD